MSFDSMLRQTCTSTRKTSAGQSASGQQRSTQVAVLSGEPCRLQQRSGAETVEDRSTTVERLTLFLRASADIHEDDQVTVGGNVYEVKYVGDGGGAGHHWECDVKLVKA